MSSLAISPDEQVGFVLRFLGRKLGVSDHAYEATRCAVTALTGEEPNIDFVLTAIASELGLGSDVPFQLFAAARCAGWIAHALEQNETGRLIRPRARYVGPEPA